MFNYIPLLFEPVSIFWFALKNSKLVKAVVSQKNKAYSRMMKNFKKILRQIIQIIISSFVREHLKFPLNVMNVIHCAI